jgi:small conductance mechanosensitive channel
MNLLTNVGDKLGAMMASGSLEKYLLTALIVVVGLVLARLAARGVERVVRRQGTEHGAAVGGKLVFYGVLILTMFAVLSQLGVKLAGLLTAAGIFTVAIGFAAQTSVSNIISGLFLLVDRPFSIGDTVKIDQTIGSVLSIDLLSTRVRTFDNLVVRIPNEALLKSTIINYTLFAVRRVEIPVSVSYSTDLRRAHEVLREALRSHTTVLDEPEPAILTALFADSGINLLVRAWVIRTDYIKAKSELTTAVKEAFDAAGIVIPFPQRVIHQAEQAQAPEESAQEVTPEVAVSEEEFAAEAPSS